MNLSHVEMSLMMQCFTPNPLLILERSGNAIQKAIGKAHFNLSCKCLAVFLPGFFATIGLREKNR